MSGYMPIYIYPSGNQISVSELPNNTVYKWIDPLGGGQMRGPAHFGDIRPDGDRGHGGMATCVNGVCTVEYHGGRKRG